MHAYALSRDDLELLGLAEITLGRVALGHGALDVARRWLMEAADHLDDCDPRYVLGVCLAMLARVEAYRGRGDAAQGVQRRAETTYPTMQQTHWMYRHEFARARAWVAASHGDLATAQRTVLSAADQCGEFSLTEITFLHDALRLGTPPSSLTARLTDLAERTDSELAHAQAAHATATEHKNPRAVESTAERFASLGATLLAAETQSSAARLHAETGDINSAQHAAARAQELLTGCPGADTPLLGPTHLPPLTQREHHVARLAASGLTNNEIAQRLVVSLRTVESRLYHAFDKLAIHTRDQLERSLNHHR